MFRHPQGLGRRTVLLIPTAVLLTCVVAAPRAKAECGDYVVIGNPAPAHRASVPAAAAHANEARMPSPRPAMPCLGLRCSRGSEPLAPLPRSPSSPVAELWAFLGDNVQLSDGQMDFLAAFFHVGQASRFRNSVFHPPR